MPIIYPSYLLMAVSLELMAILRDVDPCKKFSLLLLHLIWISLKVTVSLEAFNLANNIILYSIINFHVKECDISQKSQIEKNFILNSLDEGKDCCRAYCVKPLGHV